MRLVNPLTAATQEMRERLSGQMLQWGRAHVTQRLAHAYVTEVGRAAIDLYGGRLRVSARQTASEELNWPRARPDASSLKRQHRFPRMIVGAA